MNFTFLYTYQLRELDNQAFHGIYECSDMSLSNFTKEQHSPGQARGRIRRQAPVPLRQPLLSSLVDLHTEGHRFLRLVRN